MGKESQGILVLQAPGCLWTLSYLCQNPVLNLYTHCPSDDSTCKASSIGRVMYQLQVTEKPTKSAINKKSNFMGHPRGSVG